MKFELHTRVDDPAKRPEALAQYLAAFALHVDKLHHAPDAVLSLKQPAQFYLKLAEDLSEMAALVDSTRQITIGDQSAMRNFRSKLISLFLACTQSEPKRIAPELKHTRWAQLSIVTPPETESLILFYGLKAATHLTWRQRAAEMGVKGPSVVDYHRREGLYKLSLPKNFELLRGRE